MPHCRAIRCLLSLLIAIVAATASFAEPTQRPNVVLIITDDQGYGDLSCHGNPVLRTPNLDRLHAESVRLTDFHVNPFCAPTRAALMTGRLSDRVDVRRTLNMRNYLPAGETTMAEAFAAAGYRTALFGKWHLGHNYPFRPIDRGFERWLGIGDCGLAATSDFWGNDRFDDRYQHNGPWEAVEGFNTDVFFDRAMQFIRAQREQPFFVYLATNVPHFPWNVRDDWLTPYDGKKLPAELDKFYASIARVDWNVGRLRRLLSELNLADNTIVVFLTDNGTAHRGNVFNAGMRAHKGSVYEGGHRVPCFVRWPAGALGPPRDVAALTAHVDLLPTLADWCSLEMPAADLDGRSFAPLLRSPAADWPDRTWVLHSQNGFETPRKWTSSVVLHPRWRLINGRDLYDVKADPAQRRNVAAAQPDVVARLRAAYEDHWKRCGMAERRPAPRPIVGSPRQPIVELGADAWMLDPPTKHLWWQGEVRRGVKVNGYWPVTLQRDGTYRFKVRRWPASLDAPIRGVPTEQTADEGVVQEARWRFPPCRALPVARVRLEVAGRKLEKPVTDDATAVPFDIALGAGDADVRATLLDANGQAIAGAYYVYVRTLYY